MASRHANDPRYNVWRCMRQRCNSPRHPDYRLYGGRGIRVCDRWASYEAFIADMGPRPVGGSLDRIDNDDPYSPDNCRWASALEQAHNRRNNRATEVAAICIRELQARGAGRRQLAAAFAVPLYTVDAILYRQCWKEG